MRVFCGSYRSHLLWLLGDAEASSRQSTEAVALARREARPFSLALALDYVALLRVFEDDPAGALDWAAEAGEICRKYGFAYYLAWSEIVSGWARARQGESGEGLKDLQRGIDGLKQTGAQLRLPLYYSLLAEAYDLDRQPRQASAAIATGFAYLNRTGERWTAPELHRIHGEALERAGQRRAAAESYRKAVETAAGVGMPIYEARARAAWARVEGQGAAGVR
jgi:predicted ATPase